MALFTSCRASGSLSSCIAESKKKALKEVTGICRLLKKFNIPSNAKILDFSCGIGNHSIPLSNLGYSVIGYDPSATYLKMAVQSVSQSKLDKKKKIRFIQGNPYTSSRVLLKNHERNFDAIIIMDNSFGYFDELRDIYMLKTLRKVAKRNCILIIETENRDWRLLNFEPETFFESQELLIHAKWKFNFRTSVSIGSLKFYQKTFDNVHKFQLSLVLKMLMRLYSLHELINLIGLAGWNYKESYDDIISLEPFSNNSMSIFSVSSANQ